MAKNATQTVTSEWAQLTSGDVTSITIQNFGGDPVTIVGTVGANAPAATSDVGLVLDPGIAVINRSMTDLFPGVSGATRVYARTNPDTPSSVAEVFVSHA